MSEEQSGAGKMICKSVEKEENREKAPCWSWAKKNQMGNLNQLDSDA
jgi:hypothetical protein